MERTMPYRIIADTLSTIKKAKYELIFPLDYVGTLCARDGIKTGPGTPHGQDAYDRKLIAYRKTVKEKVKRNKIRSSDSPKESAKLVKVATYVHDATNGIVKKAEVAMTMGSERNRNASNNNPLVVRLIKKKNRKVSATQP